MKRHSSSAASARGQVRIIAGQWRGRRLPVANRPGLRPTPDRVRETLFNWLSGRVEGTHCLDLYAGSGALGLEAGSRGAQRVVLVELDPKVAAQLQHNATTLDATRIEVVNSSAETFLAQSPRIPFDLVFLDPPFNQGLLAATIDQLERGSWLSASAWIYLETEVVLSGLLLPPHWQLYRDKVAGQIRFRLYRRTPHPADTCCARLLPPDTRAEDE